MKRNKWPSVALKHLVRFGNGRDHSSVEDVDGQYPVLGSGGPFACASEYLYDGESVLFGRKGTIDKPRYINGRFWTVDTMYFTIIGPNLVPRWLYYWATTIPFSKYATNTALPSMTSEILGSLRLKLPTLLEQQQIADYLDRETDEIDKLSAEAKSLIGLAAERGTALAEKLIWGLNVPFIRLKFTADILSGHPFKSAHFRELSEDTTPLLRGINVSPHGVNWDSAVAIPSSEAGEFSDYTLQEGDLVLGLDRPIIGSGLRLAKIDKIDAGSLLVQRVARIRSKDPSTSNDWIKAALNSSRFKAHLEPDFTGVSVPHMSPRQLSEFAIPIPPIDVQNEILSQVHAEEIAVRSSIHDLQTLVTMLNERRGALISAAVTGQIDVTAQGESATEQLQDELEVPL